MNKFITECKFIVHGMPKSKSNHSLVNSDGKKILPKNSPYALYEKEIVNSILEQVGNVQFKNKIICKLDVFFKYKDRHPDLNNMTKSLCDGIEKSGIITNDRFIVSVYLSENYDFNNPRVEVSLYDFIEYMPEFNIKKRPTEEKEILNEEIELKEKKRLKAQSTPKKSKSSSRKSKQKSSGNEHVICSICGNKKNIIHAKLIAGTNEYICLKCIVINC